MYTFDNEVDERADEAEKVDEKNQASSVEENPKETTSAQWAEVAIEAVDEYGLGGAKEIGGVKKTGIVKGADAPRRDLSVKKTAVGSAENVKKADRALKKLKMPKEPKTCRS